MPLVTQAEYARLRGTSKMSVTRAVQGKRIALIQTDAGPRIDVEAADRAWARNTDTDQLVRASPEQAVTTQERAAAAAPAPTSGFPVASEQQLVTANVATPIEQLGLGLNLIDEKTRFERLRIAEKEMHVAQMRGELVSRETMVSAWSAKLIAAREALQGIPDRLSAVLAAESDAHAVHRMLATEIAGTMARLAESPGPRP